MKFKGPILMDTLYNLQNNKRQNCTVVIFYSNTEIQNIW